MNEVNSILVFLFALVIFTYGCRNKTTAQLEESFLDSSRVVKAYISTVKPYGILGKEYDLKLSTITMGKKQQIQEDLLTNNILIDKNIVFEYKNNNGYIQISDTISYLKHGDHMYELKDSLKYFAKPVETNGGAPLAWRLSITTGNSSFSIKNSLWAPFIVNIDSCSNDLFKHYNSGIDVVVHVCGLGITFGQAEESFVKILKFVRFDDPNLQILESSFILLQFSSEQLLTEYGNALVKLSKDNQFKSYTCNRAFNDAILKGKLKYVKDYDNSDKDFKPLGYEGFILYVDKYQIFH